jgi:hypothetical protein
MAQKKYTEVFYVAHSYIILHTCKNMAGTLPVKFLRRFLNITWIMFRAIAHKIRRTFLSGQECRRGQCPGILFS